MAVYERDGVEYDTEVPYLEVQTDGTVVERFWKEEDFEEKPDNRRLGRKPSNQLDLVERIHLRTLNSMYAESSFNGTLEPPAQLTSLPLIASWYMYRCRVDLARYLTPATLLKHRRAIRVACGLDILAPLP